MKTSILILTAILGITVYSLSANESFEMKTEEVGEDEYQSATEGGTKNLAVNGGTDPNVEYRKDLIKKKKEFELANGESEKIDIIKSQHDKGKKRGPQLDENVNVKVVDLGNACWFNHHFSTEIQTRQYRSPEVRVNNINRLF